MNIIKYIGFKVLAFIPIIWSTYILRPTYFPEFPIRLLICILILNTFIRLIKYFIQKHNVFSRIINHREYLSYTQLSFLPKKNILIYIKDSFENYFSIGALVKRFDVFKGVVDLLLIISFLTILDGNPFFNNYVGFVEPVELNEDETGNPNKQILYKTEDYNNLKRKNLFAYYSDFELHPRNRCFIFIETAVLNDFPKMYGKSTIEYSTLLKMYPIGIITSLVESVVKSLIWVSLIYLLFFGFSKTYRYTLDVFFKTKYIEDAVDDSY